MRKDLVSTLWGIDLGGTKVECVVLRDETVEGPLARVRIDTEAGHGYEHVLSRIEKLLGDVSNSLGLEPKTIGLAHPGVSDPESGLIKNSNSVCLNGKPLVSDLSRRMGCRVVAANDANCFALAESKFGAAANADLVFGVIMGTGVGGGIIHGGRIVEGCQGIAGEWGHNPLIENGPSCYCGRMGCVETVISGPAIEAFYAKMSGKKLPLSEITELENGDPNAQAAVERLVFHFGKALGSVINILDPDVVVLGGGVSNVRALYDKGVREVRKYVFNDSCKTTIVKNELGDSAGVFGAALLTKDTS